MQRKTKIVLGLSFAAGFLIGLFISFVAAAHAQAATVQQTVITWDAYVDPVPVPPATTIPASQQMARYQVNWSTGASCLIVASQLQTALVVIQRVLAPGVTPTLFTHTTYADSNGLNCYEVFVQFADGSWSPRSKRLYKEIISTKPAVANPVVQ